MIDNNVLLDWLLDRDPNHTVNIDKLLSKSSEIHIPDIILVELVFTLEKVYKLPRNIVSTNLNKVLDEPVFNCNRTLFQKAIICYSDHPKLSFVDCCLINYADLQHIRPIWTYDKIILEICGSKAQTPH